MYFPFVKCPASGGLSPEVITILLQHLQSSFNVVGFSITESAAVDELALAKIESIIQLFGELILHR